MRRQRSERTVVISCASTRSWPSTVRRASTRMRRNGSPRAYAQPSGRLDVRQINFVARRIPAENGIEISNLRGRARGNIARRPASKRLPR